MSRTRLSLDHLRRYAVSRTLFEPTTLGRAIRKLGFVQADPIRAPARAQDLTLRHRVANYRAGDLERRYPTLPIEEDFFVNYGFLPRAHHALMHPRIPAKPWTPARAAKAEAVYEFIRARGAVHPRAVDTHFAHGKVTNWFGGKTNATTHLLDEMHYRGILRIARREGGTRVYAARHRLADPPLRDATTERARFDALIDVLVRKYAPLPAPSLTFLMRLLNGGVPQWSTQRAEALARAKQRCPQARIDGIDWYWPAGESPAARQWQPDDAVRLMTPFDPITWDRRRFQLLWDWEYRFEAYTPEHKRKLGYYALPLLWHDRVIGWGNLTVKNGALSSTLGFIAGDPPRDPAFARALDAELTRMREFLGLGCAPTPSLCRPPRCTTICTG